MMMTRRELVQMGRLDVAAIASDVGITEVIGEQDNNVGPLFWGFLSVNDGRKHQESCQRDRKFDPFYDGTPRNQSSPTRMALT